MDRTGLFGALVDELGMALGVVATLCCMYVKVQAQVLRVLGLSGSFPIRLGVLQGCPSSPAMFSSFIDRLEAFFDQEVSDGTVAEVEAVLCAGLLIFLLLFAEDIAITSWSFAVLQWLVHALGVFCSWNHLTVNLGKLAWLVGGSVTRSGTDGWQLVY